MAGKYSDLIKKAREPETQITREPETQITREPETQITREPEKQITRNPDSQVTSTEQTTIKEQEVNLCVKVPKSLRQHWAAEAKRQGITMTAVIVEALTNKFGKPK